MKIIEIKDKFQPDPFILKHGEKFYIYCTAQDGVDLYESLSLKSGWQYKGKCLSVNGQKNYWAPCVIYTNNKFYMYYSSMPQQSTDVHLQNIKVAVADTPYGPYTYVKDVLPPFSIDAHVVENSQGLFMFYSINDYQAARAGTYVVVDAMHNPLSVSANPKTVVTPMLDEEIFEKDRFVKGQHWHTIEGAFYFKDDIHYCMYSANCYMKSTYHIAYVISKSQSDRLNEIDWERPYNGYHPLIYSDNTEQSTGHNSVIEADGQKYVVYHGRDINSDLSKEDRTARICKLFAKNGKLAVEKM